MNLNLTMGCDPEIFLQERDELRSGVGRIGGSKDFPRPLEPLGPGYAVQEDNVALEFNIPPADSMNAFSDSIATALSFLETMVEEQGLRFSKLSAASFPDVELQSPAARMFGCDPDYNAWLKGRRNPRPKAADANLRSCGGHVHVGYDKSIAHPVEVIKMMDLHLGVPSVIMDKGDLRKQLYGKAGAFRVKNFGVEYRTLSNFWIFSAELRRWVWRNTEVAVTAAVAQFALSDEDQANIVSAINDNNKYLAHELAEKFSLDVRNA